MHFLATVSKESISVLGDATGYTIKKNVVHNFGLWTAGLHCALLAGKIQTIAVIVLQKNMAGIPK